MGQERELRVLTGKVELRSGADGQPTLFVGKPVVYNQWSEKIFGFFQERMLPGAYDEHLATNPDIIATVNHNPAQLLGRTTSGTLRLRSDGQGISAEVDYPKTSYAQDLAESIRRGDLRGMSFIFDCLDDNWHMENGIHSRDVKKAKIYEVSFVTQPAYPQTEAGLRSLKTYVARTLGNCKARLDLAERI